MFRGIFVGRRSGFGAELRNDVGPEPLVRRALFGDALYSVANLRTVIERHAVFNTSLIIINEEARRDEVAQFLFHAIEFDGACDCVGRAGADLPLIIDCRALPAQIGPRR